MAAGRRGIPIKKVARDFGLDLTSFVGEAMTVISELHVDESSASAAERRRETCAALWATVLLSIESSALRSDEARALGPLLFTCLESTWKKHWNAIDEEQLRRRALKYLGHQDARSHIKTASKIVGCLFDTLEVTDPGRRRQAKRLAALMGHRMLGDIHRLNDFKMNFGIQLSLVTLLLLSAHLGGEWLSRFTTTPLVTSFSSTPEARVSVSPAQSSPLECFRSGHRPLA